MFISSFQGPASRTWTRVTEIFKLALGRFYPLPAIEVSPRVQSIESVVPDHSNLDSKIREIGAKFSSTFVDDENEIESEKWRRFHIIVCQRLSGSIDSGQIIGQMWISK